MPLNLRLTEPEAVAQILIDHFDGLVIFDDPQAKCPRRDDVRDDSL